MNKKPTFVLAMVLTLSVGVRAQQLNKEEQRSQNSVRVMKETTRQALDIALAINKYSKNNKGKMPPMTNAIVFQQALQRYTNKKNFISVGSNKPFTPNAKLSKKLLANSTQSIWFYDAKPFPGPVDAKELYRVVGYSNYSVAVTERDWQRQKKTSGLP